MGYGLYMNHILSLFTYLLTTSVSGRVPVVLSGGYPANKLPGYCSPRCGPSTYKYEIFLICPPLSQPELANSYSMV